MRFVLGVFVFLCFSLVVVFLFLVCVYCHSSSDLLHQSVLHLPMQTDACVQEHEVVSRIIVVIRKGTIFRAVSTWPFVFVPTCSLPLNNYTQWLRIAQAVASVGLRLLS